MKKLFALLLTLLMMAGVIAVAPVTASAAPALGDKVTFGTYPQSWYYPEYPVLPPESPAEGGVYTFADGTVAMFTGSNYNKIEPIEWRVLASEGGKLLLFAEKVLDWQQYYTALIGMTWENSSMRAFLNGTSGNPCGYSFIGLAFNTAEKAAIQTTAVHTPDNVPEKTYGGNDTQDKLFLLSTEELGEYGVTRVAAGTNFLGFGSGQDGVASAWFLRSPGQGIKYETGEEPPWINSEGVLRIFSDGTLAHQGVNQQDGVRPAMWVLESALTAPHAHAWSDWKKDAANHWKECACGEKSSQGAHTYGGWIVDKPATATEAGSQHRTCSVCGHVETQAIPTKGIFGTNPKWYGAWWHYLLFFIGFGFLWMWF